MSSKLFKGLIMGALVISFMLMVGSTSTMAQEQQKPANPQQKDKSKPGDKGDTPSTAAQDTITISGTVKAGSGTTLTVVDEQKAEHAITVTADTKVTKGGKDAALNTLKVNDAVTVDAQKSSDGSLTAIRIMVRS